MAFESSFGVLLCRFQHEWNAAEGGFCDRKEREAVKGEVQPTGRDAKVTSVGRSVVDLVVGWGEDEACALEKADGRYGIFHVCPFVELVCEEDAKDEEVRCGEDKACER